MSGMAGKRTAEDRVFNLVVFVILTVMGLLCLMPLIHMVAISFSDRFSVVQGEVSFWPVHFTLASYQMILGDAMYIRSFYVSFLRVLVGTSINMVVTVLTAYPLSLNKKEFPARNAYMYYTLFTWMFYGGVVAWYLAVKNVGLNGSFWALVIPGGLPIYNAIMVMNFFRNLPREIREAAMMDGAGHATLLTKVYLPMSQPVLATVCLWCVVNHWNDWFQARLFIDQQKWVPLATYLQSFDIDPTALAKYDTSKADMIEKLTGRSFNAAKIIIAMIPVLVVYPFLQKYFVKGITLGAVKG